jgi:hypothetical protein
VVFTFLPWIFPILHFHQADRPSDVAFRGLPEEPACLLWSLAILFLANGITVNVENKGTLETARKIAAHESPRTTTLYDRTDDRLTLDEIEKISV